MSQFKTFVLPSESDEAQERALNDFLRSHRIVSVVKAYESAMWHFCVEWCDDGRTSICGRILKYAERVDYMKVLPPEVFSVFAKLREKRKELSQKAAIPPFTVATDAQLAEMAKLKGPTLSKIGEIEGIGESRLKAYGEAFLSVLTDESS